MVEEMDFDDGSLSGEIGNSVIRYGRISYYLDDKITTNTRLSPSQYIHTALPTSLTVALLIV